MRASRFWWRLAGRGCAALCAALYAALCALSCARAPQSRTMFVFGTVCQVRVYDKAPSAVLEGVFDRLLELERVFSPNMPESALFAINAAAGQAPVAVPADVFTVLQAALTVAEYSGGALDPSVGPLVRLWGIATDAPRVPPPNQIEQARAAVDYRLIQLDAAAGTVFLPRAGMALDLGALVKGYAADEAARLLREAGVRRALIDLGGNIAAVGERRAGRQPWRIGIQAPNAPRGTYAAVLPCANSTLVTSGTYERFFEEGGIRYHHILSPWTGKPAASALASVTIIADISQPNASLYADALSTAIFVLGAEQGRQLLARFPGFSAVFIDDAGVITTIDAH